MESRTEISEGRSEMNQQMIIPTSTFSHRIINDFSLSDTDILNLDRYYLLHWSGKFLRKTYDNEAVITRENIRYQMVFKSDIRECFKSSQVMISFRYISSVYPYGYALIKIKQD